MNQNRYCARAIVCALSILSCLRTSAMEHRARTCKPLALCAFEAVDSHELVDRVVTDPVIRSLLDQSQPLAPSLRTAFLKAYVPRVITMDQQSYPLAIDNPTSFIMYTDDYCTITAHHTLALIRLRSGTIEQLRPPLVGMIKACTIGMVPDGSLICAYRRPNAHRFDYYIYDQTFKVLQRYENRPPCPSLFDIHHNEDIPAQIALIDELEAICTPDEAFTYVVAPRHGIGIALNDEMLILYNNANKTTTSVCHSVHNRTKICITPDGQTLIIGTQSQGPIGYCLTSKQWIRFQGARTCGIYKNLCMSPTGTFLAQLNPQGKLTIWELATGVRLAKKYGVEVVSFDPISERLLFVANSFVFRQNIQVIDLQPLLTPVSASMHLLLTACLTQTATLWHDHRELFESLDNQVRGLLVQLLEKNHSHCTLC